MMHSIQLLFFLLLLHTAIATDEISDTGISVELKSISDSPSTVGACLLDREDELDFTEDVVPTGNFVSRLLKKLTKKRKKSNLFKKTKEKKKSNLFKETIEPKKTVKKKTKNDRKDKKKNDKEEEKLTKKEKKELASLLKPDEKLTKKEKKQKKLKKKDKKENKVNEGDKIDHRAIHIRNSCKAPLNIYRTCYDRALDPSNDLEEDELRLQTPFSAPFIDDDEWLVSDSMYLVLTELSSDPTDGDCSDVLGFEELALKYLKVCSSKSEILLAVVHFCVNMECLRIVPPIFVKDNIGGEDTFSPLCVFIGNSTADETPMSGIQSSEKSVRTKSGEEIDVSTTAMKISVVFAFKKEFAKEVTDTSPNSRGLVHTPRFLASCSNGGFGMCCSGSAINSSGASPSAKCSGGCGSRRCKKKKPKKPKKKLRRGLIGSLIVPDLFDVEFIDAVNSYSDYDPVETRAVVQADNVGNVAICAVNRYIQDMIRPRVELEQSARAFKCRVYDEADCSKNEDIIREMDETRSFCEARGDSDYSSYFPTIAPSLHPTLNPMLDPTESPNSSPSTTPTNKPTTLPTLPPTTVSPTPEPTVVSQKIRPPPNNPTSRPTLLTPQPKVRPTNEPTVSP
eukprot:CCRYP_014212-RE/>CCRYP_014212-RE protein AED:0.15 eAED:0.16 QI:254/1/1/1/0.70/0.83/18/800/621